MLWIKAVKLEPAQREGDWLFPTLTPLFEENVSAARDAALATLARWPPQSRRRSRRWCQTPRSPGWPKQGLTQRGRPMHHRSRCQARPNPYPQFRRSTCSRIVCVAAAAVVSAAPSVACAPRSALWPEPRPRQCPRRHRPTAGPVWCQRPSRRPGMPPGRAWLRRARSPHGGATRRACARPQTYPFVPHCLYLERCPEAAPRHRACCARVPPSVPLPSRALCTPAAYAAAACKMGGDPT